MATEIFVFDVTAATPWLLASYMPIKIVINCKLNINHLHTVGFYLKYQFKWYLFACWRVYGILRTFIPGPKHPLAIRSSIMSHITFKMCQFVLQIYLRDYQYDFDLDMLFYGLVRVYFNLLILHIKIYVRLVTFSDSFSCPKTSVPLISYY